MAISEAERAHCKICSWTWCAWSTFRLMFAFRISSYSPFWYLAHFICRRSYGYLFWCNFFCAVLDYMSKLGYFYVYINVCSLYVSVHNNIIKNWIKCTHCSTDQFAYNRPTRSSQHRNTLCRNCSKMHTTYFIGTCTMYIRSLSITTYFYACLKCWFYVSVYVCEYECDCRAKTSASMKSKTFKRSIVNLVLRDRSNCSLFDERIKTVGNIHIHVQIHIYFATTIS